MRAVNADELLFYLTHKRPDGSNKHNFKDGYKDALEEMTDILRKATVLGHDPKTKERYIDADDLQTHIKKMGEDSDLSSLYVRGYNSAVMAFRSKIHSLHEVEIHK